MKNAATPENSANLLWQPYDSDGCSPGSKSPPGAFCLSIITTLRSQEMLRDQCLTCQWRDESDGRGCGEPGRAAAKATGAGSAPGGPSRIPSPAGVLPPRARNPLSLRGFGLAAAGSENRLVAAAVGAVCRNEWPAAVDRGRSRRYGPRAAAACAPPDGA